MTAFLMLFLSLLFIVISLGWLFAILIGYCFVLEKKGVDPDDAWAYWGFLGISLVGCGVIAYIFVTVCVPLIDLVFITTGLTGS